MQTFWKRRIFFVLQHSGLGMVSQECSTFNRRGNLQSSSIHFLGFNKYWSFMVLSSVAANLFEYYLLQTYFGPNLKTTTKSKGYRLSNDTVILSKSYFYF